VKPKKEKKETREYRVYFVQTETFYVDVEAEDEKTAVAMANDEWETGAYNEVGDCSVEATEIEDIKQGTLSNINY